MADDDVLLFSNIALDDADTSGQTSNVGEPSIASNGDQILFTGNWYASRSLDRGATWAHISPFTFLPAVDGGFCCDQTVLYEPSRDMTIWLLQYIEAGGTNTLRLAVKKGPTLGNNNWYWYDFKPEQVNNGWAGEWFDYNHAALSDNFLYVGTNAFSASGDSFRRSIIFRFPLGPIADGTGFSYNYYDTNQNGSLRCVQGARGTMYFASHNSLAQIRLFEWPENSANLTIYDIDVRQWAAGSYSAPVNGAGNWLARADPRITAGFVGGGRIGFMWTANSDANRAMPYIRVVRIDEQSKQLVDEPDIWNPNFAFAYPDATPNDRGQLGVTMALGGGQFNPSHVVGVRADNDTSWRLVFSSIGTHTPTRPMWGDYLTCRRKSPDGLTWVAAGYTLQGGTDQSDVQPRFVHFGRRANRDSTNRWFGV